MWTHQAVFRWVLELLAENRSENIDVVVEVKAFLSNLREGTEAEYPCVVDQNVQFSKCGIHFSE